MKFLDKIAMNRLIQILTNFILAVLKIFKPNDKLPIPPIEKKRRPLKDLIDRLIK